MGSVDTRQYPFIEAWFQRCKTHIPNYEQVCGEGAQSFGDMYKKAKAANVRRMESNIRRLWKFVTRSIKGQPAFFVAHTAKM